MKARIWSTDNLERLDRLIAKGKGVKGMPGHVYTLYEDAFEEWKTSSLDFILEEIGEDSPYYEDFTARANEASLSSCNAGISVLMALRESLEKSRPKEGELLSTVEEGQQEKPKEEKPPIAIKWAKPAKKSRPGAKGIPKKGPAVKEKVCEVATPNVMGMLEGILWQAEVQLSQGHKDAAAVLCGAVLEEALRWMSTKHNIPTKEWDTIGDLNDRLLNKGVCHESMHKRVVSWWYLPSSSRLVHTKPLGLLSR